MATYQPTLTLSIDAQCKVSGTICLVHPTAKRPSSLVPEDLAADIVKAKGLANVKNGCTHFSRRRMPVLKVAAFWENVLANKQGHSGMTVSHLCHNEVCLNPWHVCMEWTGKSTGRNGCAGVALCAHITRCMVCGPCTYI